MTRVVTFVVVIGLLGCSLPAVRSQGPEPVEAVITFGTRDVSEQIFALRAPSPVNWESAPTVALPAGASIGYSAIGASDTTSKPVVLIVHNLAGSIGPLSVTSALVGTRTALSGTPGTSVAARPCVGASWMSAFFVEGLGPVPTAPAVVQYRVDGVMYTLRVDPVRDMVRSLQAVRLRAENVPTRISADSNRIVSFRLAGLDASAVPVIAWRTRRGWTAQGVLGQSVEVWDRVTDGGDWTGLEWMFFILRTPQDCS